MDTLTNIFTNLNVIGDITAENLFASNKIKTKKLELTEELQIGTCDSENNYWAIVIRGSDFYACNGIKWSILTTAESQCWLLKDSYSILTPQSPDLCSGPTTNATDFSSGSVSWYIRTCVDTECHTPNYSNGNAT